MSGPVTRYWRHAGNRIQISPSRPSITKSVQGCYCCRWPRPRSAIRRVLRPTRTEWRRKNDDRRNLRGFDAAGFGRSRSAWPAVEFGRGTTPPAPGHSITGYATLRETHGARNGPLVSQLFPQRSGSLRSHRAGATRGKTKRARGRSLRWPETATGSCLRPGRRSRLSFSR